MQNHKPEAVECINQRKKQEQGERREKSGAGAVENDRLVYLQDWM